MKIISRLVVSGVKATSSSTRMPVPLFPLPTLMTVGIWITRTQTRRWISRLPMYYAMFRLSATRQGSSRYIRIMKRSRNIRVYWSHAISKSSRNAWKRPVWLTWRMTLWWLPANGRPCCTGRISRWTCVRRNGAVSSCLICRIIRDRAQLMSESWMLLWKVKGWSRRKNGGISVRKWFLCSARRSSVGQTMRRSPERLR